MSCCGCCTNVKIGWIVGARAAWVSCSHNLAPVLQVAKPLPTLTDTVKFARICSHTRLPDHELTTLLLMALVSCFRLIFGEAAQGSSEVSGAELRLGHQYEAIASSGWRC